MRNFKALALVIFSCSFVSVGCNQNINEMPMYGSLQKNEHQKEADRKFIEDAVRGAGSREKACEMMIQRGWEYLGKQDLSTAMKRFNQAWLLNEQNPKVYWGFGAVLAVQNNFDESIKMFEKASQLDPENPRLKVDFANTYIGKADKDSRSKEEKQRCLNLAISQLEAAVLITPGLEPAYFIWATALYNMDNYQGAWEKIHKAKSLGGKTINPAFESALKAKMPDPSVHSPQ